MRSPNPARTPSHAAAGRRQGGVEAAPWLLGGAVVAAAATGAYLILRKVTSVEAALARPAVRDFVHDGKRLGQIIAEIPAWQLRGRGPVSTRTWVPLNSSEQVLQMLTPRRRGQFEAFLAGLRILAAEHGANSIRTAHFAYDQRSQFALLMHAGLDLMSPLERVRFSMSPSKVAKGAEAIRDIVDESVVAAHAMGRLFFLPSATGALAYAWEGARAGREAGRRVSQASAYMGMITVHELLHNASQVGRSVGGTKWLEEGGAQLLASARGVPERAARTLGLPIKAEAVDTLTKVARGRRYMTRHIVYGNYTEMVARLAKASGLDVNTVAGRNRLLALFQGPREQLVSTLATEATRHAPDPVKAAQRLGELIEVAASPKAVRRALRSISAS